MIQPAPQYSRMNAMNGDRASNPNRRSIDLTAVRVLLAEPNELTRDTLAKFLVACGAEVRTASNGLECIEQLRDFQPHVLVIEPEMPWGGGAGVMEWMLSDPGIPTAPILALTAARDLDQLQRILKFPLYDLVVKPLGPRQLAIKIRWVVDFAPKLGKIGWPR